MEDDPRAWDNWRPVLLRPISEYLSPAESAVLAAELEKAIDAAITQAFRDPAFQDAGHAEAVMAARLGFFASKCATVCARHAFHAAMLASQKLLAQDIADIRGQIAALLEPRGNDGR